MVDDVAQEAGTSVIRAPVGEVNVALRMRSEGAVIGGEGNGGVILPELHLGRDAPLGVALVLQMLAEDGAPLLQVRRRATALRDHQGQAGPAERAARHSV